MHNMNVVTKKAAALAQATTDYAYGLQNIRCVLMTIHLPLPFMDAVEFMLFADIWHVIKTKHTLL